jgi:hypothetical protein
MRQLEEENRKLKQIVADLSLDKAMLQHIVAKKSRAFAAARAGARADALVRLQPAQCHARGQRVAGQLLLQAGQEGRDRAAHAHQGDHQHTRAPRLSPSSRAAAP